MLAYLAYYDVINSHIPHFVDQTWKINIAIALVLTHITVVAVTVYLHRYATHRAIDLHWIVANFFQFWIWLTTGMDPEAWRAVHLNHHQYVDTARDPHSPIAEMKELGITEPLGRFLYMTRFVILLHGMMRYIRWIKVNPDKVSLHLQMLVNKGIMKERFFSPHGKLGVFVCLPLCDILLFGLPGVFIWLTQLVWIPVLAAGVINGVGHWMGYRNYPTEDFSRNIIPIGIILCGEELHNNHHQYGSSAKFSKKWWEFDIGWMYIKIFESLGLATVRRN